ncbi:hypothetical protein A2870_00280 [Candidatus Curtissbacteria bacterium RIFCSPHIGHO2_01_FULL_41_11]|uniref:Serine aminopeptidase S33 domain-containing protein n=1 Tax=Candidatus Curtissbacteria bacterium RIFCSPHIGHO2_01_FULL_41_11 TaxID=1797711 RepID=A0A1F5G4Y6_9BACT|nr:MAG: hypothetical protein A2870_00280 [Candidatus Curtissbacteria bacterium RIFCSPHIGHO2_01_FULL_41_11]
MESLKGDETKASPFPFEDLTIPYLAKREYKSALGSLNEVSRNSNYTSYLTGYDSDGFRINGLLTIPNVIDPQGDRRKYPAVIFIHGYIAPAQYKTLVNYASYVDYLAKNGFVVFKIDLRGHADSEGEPGGAYYSSDYIIDVLNARAALASSDFVNADKVGLWGHSMAGNVVFRSLAAKGDIPAAVIWAGAVYSYEDFQQFSINDDSYRPPDTNAERARKRRELFNTYGEFSADSDFWQKVPATNYLNNIKGAIQIHHAANDDVVDINYSRNLSSILDKTSIPHELYEYTSGGHNLTGDSFNLAMQRTVDFFREHLR